MAPPDDLTQTISAGMGTLAAKIQRYNEALVERLHGLDAKIERLTKRVQALERELVRDAPKDE